MVLPRSLGKLDPKLCMWCFISMRKQQKEPEPPSGWVGPKCQLLQLGLMEAVLKAGFHLRETETGGLEEAKAEARLATEQEGTGGTKLVWDDA